MIKRFKSNETQKITRILNNNGVISVPTDTVFGLCAKVSSQTAYNKLIKIKNRPLDKSFPIMCADLKQINKVAIVTETAGKIINEFMPGPITIILKRKPYLPEYITNGKDTIAIRMATSKDLENILREIDNPVFMTSANQSGEPVCTNLDEIEKNCPLLDAMVEGNVLFGKASTIIDCSQDEISVLREGPISLEQIKKIL